VLAVESISIFSSIMAIARRGLDMGDRDECPEVNDRGGANLAGSPRRPSCLSRRSRVRFITVDIHCSLSYAC
jgi:hypothetical protein